MKSLGAFFSRRDDGRLGQAAARRRRGSPEHDAVMEVDEASAYEHRVGLRRKTPRSIRSKGYGIQLSTVELRRWQWLRWLGCSRAQSTNQGDVRATREVGEAYRAVSGRRRRLTAAEI